MGPPQSPQGFPDVNNPRKPTFSDWVLAGALFVLGTFLFSMAIYLSLYGTMAESELTLVEGLVTERNVQRLSFRGASKEILEFTVDGHRTEYSSDNPKFQEVLDAIRINSPTRIWVATGPKAIVPITGRVKLYKVNSGEKAILTYPEVVANDRSSWWTALPVGAVLFIGGSLLLYFYFKQRRRYNAWVAALAG